MRDRYAIRTEGGPNDGELREVELDTLGSWPPPLTLPGVFRGGTYIRRSYTGKPRTEGRRVATYEWVATHAP